MAYIKALAKQIAASLASVWTTENRLPVDTGSTANSVTVQDPTTPENKLKLNANGEVTVANPPTGYSTESTLAAIKTSLEERIGGTTDAPAADYNSASGLSGLLRLVAKLLFDGNSAASATGNIKQQLRFLAENSAGGTQYDSGNIPTTPRGNLFLAIKSTGEVIPVEVDDSGYIKVAIATGATPAPTEYFDGSTVVAPVGSLTLGKEPDGTLSGLQLDSNGSLKVTAPTPLPVTVSGGGVSGTQYLDGVTQTTPVGTVSLAQKTSGVLKTLQLNTDNYLQVNTPNLSNTQYTTGVIQTTPTGNVVLGNKSGVLIPLQLDTNNYLQVNTPNLSNIQYVDGVTQATPIGSVALAFKSGGTLKALQLDSANYLQVSSPEIRDKIGSPGDAANSTGTLIQQMRYLIESSYDTITSAINVVNGTGNITLLSAVAGKKIAIWYIYTTISGGVTLTLKNGATVISGDFTTGAAAFGYTRPIILSINTAFVVTPSAATTLKGFIIWQLI